MEDELHDLRDRLARAEARNAKLVESNERTRRTLADALRHERQYRNAVLSDAVFFYRVDLTEGIIKDSMINHKGKDVLARVGMSIPCAADEFTERWAESHVPIQYRLHYIESQRCENLLRSYAEGNRDVTIEYELEDDEDGILFIRKTVLLLADASTGHIEGLNIYKDITDERAMQERINQALRSAFNEANEANEAKSRFLSQMSHDMRTPLNAVIGMTEIARHHLDDPVELKRCLSKIDGAGRDLVNLVDGVLAMSNIEGGGIKRQYGAFVLTETLREVIDQCSYLVTLHHHELTVDFSTIRDDRLMGDALHLKQLLASVLGNALKYTPDGGHVKFAAVQPPGIHPEYAFFEFIIEDDGIGMSSEFQKRMFQPFAREDDARVTAVAGTGLGLSIAYRLIKMMDGSVEVESEPGVGTRFKISIGIERQNARLFPATGGDARARLEDMDLSSRTILLCEDNALNREMATQIIGVTGADVEVAVDGREGLEKFSHSEPDHFDMVLMDIRMPVMDGYEATAAIRQLDRQDASDVPIVALSANTLVEDMCRSREMGMNAHLSKPIDVNELARTLAYFLC